MGGRITFEQLQPPYGEINVFVGYGTTLFQSTMEEDDNFPGMEPIQHSVVGVLKSGSQIVDSIAEVVSVWSSECVSMLFKQSDDYPYFCPAA